MNTAFEPCRPCEAPAPRWRRHSSLWRGWFEAYDFSSAETETNSRLSTSR